MGGSQSQTVKSELTPEQRRLVAATESLAAQQEGLIGESADLARATAGTLTGLAGEEDALAGLRNMLAASDLQFTQNTSAPIQEMLTLDQANRILSGIRPSDEQRGFLSDLANQQIAAGQSDIGRGLENQLFSLREELAPALGLRPSDTPIRDRGARSAEDALRQNAQLVNEVRGREAAGLIDYPLQENQVFGGLASQQLNLGQATSQFQEQLRQQALANRAALQQQQVGQLAGLATGFQAPIGTAVGSITPTTTTTTSGTPGVLGYANALAGGVNAASQAGLFGGTGGASLPANQYSMSGYGGPFGTGLY